MKSLLICGAVLAASSISPATFANEMPGAGSLTCTSKGRQQIPVKHATEKRILLISNAECTFGNEGSNSIVIWYVTQVELNFTSGSGRLITGTGYGKNGDKTVLAMRFQDGHWNLKVVDGRLAGWSAKGSAGITAGTHQDRVMHWTSRPISPTVMKVEYRIE